VVAARPLVGAGCRGLPADLPLLVDPGGDRDRRARDHGACAAAGARPESGRRGRARAARLAYNLLSAALSLPFGGLSDRFGRRPLLLAGYLLYALAYGAAAFSPTRAGATVAFLTLAVHSAIIEGQSRSIIADVVPRERRATAFGAYHGVVGAALLPASLVAGLLWERVGPQAPFALGSLLALAAAIALVVLLPSAERPAVSDA
jgi:MFS family permease